ncbi:MAG: hypothetical protein Q9196_002394 [Gyalolechia fulgens]
MQLDPSVLRALSLDPATTTVSAHGSSGFNATAKISTTHPDDGGGTRRPGYYFMKTSSAGRDAETMFRGEHASLNAIRGAVPSLCPASLATGVCADGTTAFLVTEFVDLGPSRADDAAGGAAGAADEDDTIGSGMSLAAKLGKLHTTPAPVPEGWTEPGFGFPETTCCGDTAQPNGYMRSWADFYARNRLLAVLDKCERKHGTDGGLRDLVERVVETVVPRLIGDEHLRDCGTGGVTPVVVHGDLWSGNKGRGRIGGKGAVEDVIFDPSAVYGHSEYELGIMNMFGGFGKSFFDEYHKICPKTPPVEEYPDRLKLYEL